MTDAEHPFQREVVQIFQSGWSESNRKRSIQTAAEHLSLKTAESGSRSGIYIWSSIQAIQQCASKNPVAIDFMLFVFQAAAKQFPQSVGNEYGSGSKAGFTQLKYWIIEQASGFQGVHFPSTVGKPDTQDPSNLRFSKAEVQEQLNAVLERLEDWREERRTWIINAAIRARCMSLNILEHDTEGTEAEALIDSALGSKQLSESEYIGICILLRGCAETFSTRLGKQGKGQKFGEWARDFALAITVPCSFSAKAHTELVLRNIKDGPHDESSQELFGPDKWLGL
ncbi:uncharacterized protein K452DRAFT_302866 [Aplosporella prunicola CBS 121167]|uniref:Uncharacterized protein n=1 Tax=Aplosporella prunicola CBS 121167 TaxID=1176127 RepID=A0A6A6AW98_9PEZI|nr:uncharacterized protein K452DRAFT_302866 [Aplosporella prunicola CBS 121167]KAF2136272.1 hypothetical protein K452DRAFT_302866 [Aplosporella prunicola CBS 121167]